MLMLTVQRRCDSRAPEELSNEVDDVGQVSNDLFARQASSQVKDTRQILTAEHGPNQAVVALCILDVLLILQAQRNNLKAQGLMLTKPTLVNAYTLHTPCTQL